MPPRPIVLAEHDPAWQHAFAREAGRIRPAFGSLLVELHHIGSTAIPNIRAKPVIDILAVIVDVQTLDTRSKDFEALGYEVMGEFGLPGRRYFRRDDSAGVRTHQLHAYAPESSREIERHLDVRDFLRQNPDVASAYDALKLVLVDRCRDDMRCYSDGKTTFIREVEHRAARWKRDSRVDRRPYSDR